MTQEEAHGFREEISLLRIPLGFYAIVGTEEIKVPGSEVEMFSELTQKAQGKLVTMLV